MKRLLVALVILVVVSYGVFESRRLVKGPTIIIDSPQDGSATTTALVMVTGTAKNISFLSINDGPAYTDEDGKFVYRFSPPLGYTVVTVAATDRFGRRASEKITFNIINFCPAYG
jgi:hypothetical protein